LNDAITSEIGLARGCGAATTPRAALLLDHECLPGLDTCEYCIEILPRVSRRDVCRCHIQDDSPVSRRHQALPFAIAQARLHAPCPAQYNSC
jgi:hypothetical protein